MEEYCAIFQFSFGNHVCELSFHVPCKITESTYYSIGICTVLCATSLWKLKYNNRSANQNESRKVHYGNKIKIIEIAESAMGSNHAGFK